MKVSFVSGTYFDKPCLRVIARIAPSKKNGLAKKMQKTWRIVADRAGPEEVKLGAMAEAKRWESKVMAGIERERALKEAVAQHNAATHVSDSAPSPASTPSTVPPSGSPP